MRSLVRLQCCWLVGRFGFALCPDYFENEELSKLMQRLRIGFRLIAISYFPLYEATRRENLRCSNLSSEQYKKFHGNGQEFWHGHASHELGRTLTDMDNKKADPSEYSSEFEYFFVWSFFLLRKSKKKKTIVHQSIQTAFFLHRFANIKRFHHRCWCKQNPWTSTKCLT